MKQALIVVDVQNDFYEGGALPVPGAKKINNEVNRLLRQDNYDIIVASQDWHPDNHRSFAVNMGQRPFSTYTEEEGLGPVLWPVHCRQGTPGADFHGAIEAEYFDVIIRKGTDSDIDSYSVFRENDGTDLGLAGMLDSLNIKKVTICGLAFDVCVKFTALDAVKNGFDTEVLMKATRGVEAEEGDIARTRRELKETGVGIVD